MSNWLHSTLLYLRTDSSGLEAGGQLADEETQNTIRAINCQIIEGFGPYWSMGATLRLEGMSCTQPTPQCVADMRGNTIIYLWNEADIMLVISTKKKNTSFKIC